ncbi:alpha/beta fold hydrolase [Hamadaea tsunoensis]|uniref:alpha/beta fold hydrolase n=1 Tax=Hamadaea tsunoensis TaxID=53368 RepID=UPI00040F99CD|nr:alpha/beta hydrolase [Hamadaea tsunoensis]
MKHSQHEIESADGTRIGMRVYGETGPGIVALHGGMKSARDFDRLATELAADFRVYVPDRRGRGMSGPHGDGYGMHKEVQDVSAILAATGARLGFGLSSGALVLLRTALADAGALDRIALYEPPLQIAGGIPVDFMARYEREIDEGRNAAALITVLRGLEADPLFTRLPRAVLTPMIAVGLRLDKTIGELVPTERYDFQLIREMADTQAEYAGLTPRVLLLDGTKSPHFLREPLDTLQRVLPAADRVSFDGLTHEGPEDDGGPLLVARTLRGFFTAP